MKTSSDPLSIRKSRKTKLKSSGETPGKVKSVAEKSRRDAKIPADRGAYEKQSESQGSE